MPHRFTSIKKFMAPTTIVLTYSLIFALSPPAHTHTHTTKLAHITVSILVHNSVIEKMYLNISIIDKCSNITHHNNTPAVKSGRVREKNWYRNTRYDDDEGSIGRETAAAFVLDTRFSLVLVARTSSHSLVLANFLDVYLRLSWLHFNMAEEKRREKKTMEVWAIDFSNYAGCSLMRHMHGMCIGMLDANNRQFTRAQQNTSSSNRSSVSATMPSTMMMTTMKTTTGTTTKSNDANMTTVTRIEMCQASR